MTPILPSHATKPTCELDPPKNTNNISIFRCFSGYRGHPLVYERCCYPDYNGNLCHSREGGNPDKPIKNIAFVSIFKLFFWIPAFAGMTL